MFDYKESLTSVDFVICERFETRYATRAHTYVPRATATVCRIKFRFFSRTSELICIEKVYNTRKYNNCHKVKVN